MAITGRIDLVHANDSRDPFDSGADRHANFGDGEVGTEALAEVVRTAAVPVVVETRAAGRARAPTLPGSRRTSNSDWHFSASVGRRPLVPEERVKSCFG